MFFWHLLVHPPSSTLGLIAPYILDRICSTMGHEIQFGFDKVIDPSIKDCERNARSFDRSYFYDITGLSQKRSGYWLATLRNSHFKNSSIQHLIYEWDENSHLVKKSCL